MRVQIIIESICCLSSLSMPLLLTSSFASSPFPLSCCHLNKLKVTQSTTADSPTLNSIILCLYSESALLTSWMGDVLCLIINCSTHRSCLLSRWMWLPFFPSYFESLDILVTKRKLQQSMPVPENNSALFALLLICLAFARFYFA